MQISVTSLEACKETCRQTLGCMGLDFSVGRCDIWTGLGGIQAGEEIEDHVTSCRYCRDSQVIYDSSQGTAVCTGCGTVLEDNSLFHQSDRECCQRL
eukprot:g28497.t1